MRLLNTRSLELSEFFGKDIPKYAILSHRWEEDEITFQDILLKIAGREDKKGWAKLEACRAQALKDDFEWFWDDTCCIDKSSSAELSEAINSMFNWYRGAEVCYAYLSDVFDGVTMSAVWRSGSEFRRSKWFTRGWTLQELLAPKRLVFFNRDWVEIGTRDVHEPAISEITGIHDMKSFGTASIAQKMSWASKRETTRVEDMAYSLMGLFKVNMPLLYGEGERSFVRLQREILLVSDDESIFAWKARDDFTGSLLAGSPAAFCESGDIVHRIYDYEKPYYWMTNKGLRMECPLLPAKSGELADADDTFLAPLQCQHLQQSQVPAVILRRVIRNTFARISPGELTLLPAHELGRLRAQMDTQPETRQIVHVKQSSDSEIAFHDPYGFEIPSSALAEKGYVNSHKYCSNERHSRWIRYGWEGDGVVIDEIDREGIIVAFEYIRDRTRRHMYQRILIVIIVHAHRPRLVVYVPNENFSIAPRGFCCDESHGDMPLDMLQKHEQEANVEMNKQLRLRFPLRFPLDFGLKDWGWEAVKDKSISATSGSEIMSYTLKRDSSNLEVQKYKVEITIADSKLGSISLK